MKYNKPMDFNLKHYLKKNRIIINDHLSFILDSFDQNRELIKAIRHSLMAGGKRLRPILCMAAALACNKDDRLALPSGCAIEMIHTYSLIHDDLPAMDNDDLRRGRPTCHKMFSEAVALLAGDALLTYAFNILSMPQTVFDVYPDNDIRINLIARLSNASGIQGMVEGQILDMQSYQGHQDDLLDHLKKIHALKTGQMISVSVESGALSVGADPEKIEKLVTYADKIGLAFQVVDDILDIEGDPQVMGKAAGSDQLNDKMTFPSIIGLEQSKKYAKELVSDAIDCLSQFDKAAEPLRAIAEYIINRDR
ncbi:MAG: polyprenyl synthetase family protein [Pseudomonadota bacterium]